MPASPYLRFSRARWAALAAEAVDVDAARAEEPAVPHDELRDVYLPLVHLLRLHARELAKLRRATGRFLRRRGTSQPYVVGLTGSVAVGKSTSARVLRALLAQAPEHPSVELVTTDGFLYPNRVLAERGLTARKGFPESFDTARLVRFVADARRGQSGLTVPRYSHEVYDVLEVEEPIAERPNVLIVEGINVLQDPELLGLLDFTIYLDAPARAIRRWYVERFMALREAAKDDPTLFYHRLAALPEGEAKALAARVWREVNERNLREHILPTRVRARLVLEKAPDHRVRSVLLRPF